MRSRFLTEIAMVVIAFFVLCLIGKPFLALLLMLSYLGWRLRFIIKYIYLSKRNKRNVVFR